MLVGVKRMSSLLINEQPLMVIPSLAEAIGLNEAVILQQIHFLLNYSNNEHDGAKWVYNTQEDWIRVFKWIKSPKTFRRYLDSLKARNLILVEKLSKHFGGSSFEQKLYYTVNYAALDGLNLNGEVPLGQVDPMEKGKTTDLACTSDDSSSGQDDPMDQGDVTGPACTPDSGPSGQHDPMEGANLPVPFGQDDPLSKGQNAPFSKGHYDPMFQENTQKKSPRDEDASAAAAPDEFAHIFNQPSGQRFPMPLDWQPTERLYELCQTRGISLEAMTPDQKGDLINEFRCYWNSQPEAVQSQGQWENKLVQRLVRVAAKQAGAMANLQQAGQPDRRTSRQAVTASVMNIADTDW